MNTTSSRTSEINDVLSAAKVSVEGQEYVSRSRCTDWLLDVLNASDVPVIRDEVKEALGDFSHGNIAKVEEFVAALDRISMVVLLADA